MSRRIDQRRAAFALTFVRGYPGDTAMVDKMSTHIQKTPIRILQNGLGQALAFLLSDGGEPAHDLYDKLQEWLCGDRNESCPCRVYTTGPVDLIKRLVEGDRAAYLRAQEEALLLFNWIKKFSDAYLGQPVGGR